MQDFIERLRAKPEHVRKQIAVGTASTITGVVALGWLVALVAGGTLAIDTTTPPPSDNLAEDTKSGLDSLMGAAGAFGEEVDPELTVIESNTKSTLDRHEQTVDSRTVIPF